MSNINEYKITVENILQESQFNLNIDNLAYTLPKVNNPRGPGEIGAVQIATNKPVNNKNFSLSGKTESPSFQFEAFERFQPSNVDSVYNDRSYDPVSNVHTLDKLITELQNSTVSGSNAEALKLTNFFSQDSANNYVVRTVKEQRRWLRDIIHNPGLRASWRIFGGSYDWRSLNVNDENAGTPIFLLNADIEPSGENIGRGTGILQFNVGDRL